MAFAIPARALQERSFQVPQFGYRDWLFTDYDMDVLETGQPLPTLTAALRKRGMPFVAERGDFRGKKFWWPDIRLVGYDRYGKQIYPRDLPWHKIRSQGLDRFTAVEVMIYADCDQAQYPTGKGAAFVEAVNDCAMLGHIQVRVITPKFKRWDPCEECGGYDAVVRTNRRLLLTATS